MRVHRRFPWPTIRASTICSSISRLLVMPSIASPLTSGPTNSTPPSSPASSSGIFTLKVVCSQTLPGVPRVLSNLKVLDVHYTVELEPHLNSAQFDALAALISGCPGLEELSVKVVPEVAGLMLKIAAPRLCHLEIKANSTGWTVELVSLLPDLAHAKLRLPFFRYAQEGGSKLLHILQSISQVQKLELLDGSPSLPVSRRGFHHHLEETQEFWNTHGSGDLFQCLRTMKVIAVYLSYNYLQFIKLILSKAHVLEKFSIVHHPEIESSRLEACIEIMKFKRASPEAEIIYKVDK